MSRKFPAIRYTIQDMFLLMGERIARCNTFLFYKSCLKKLFVTGRCLGLSFAQFVFGYFFKHETAL